MSYGNQRAARLAGFLVKNYSWLLGNRAAWFMKFFFMGLVATAKAFVCSWGSVST
jgi:hypothetical protein